jgi:hypothetical protein
MRNYRRTRFLDPFTSQVRLNERKARRIDPLDAPQNPGH